MVTEPPEQDGQDWGTDGSDHLLPGMGEFLEDAAIQRRLNRTTRSMALVVHPSFLLQDAGRRRGPLPAQRLCPWVPALYFQIQGRPTVLTGLLPFP